MLTFANYELNTTYSRGWWECHCFCRYLDVKQSFGWIQMLTSDSRGKVRWQFILRGGMYVCTRFHGNPSNSCSDISLQTTNVNLMVLKDQGLTKVIRMTWMYRISWQLNSCWEDISPWTQSVRPTDWPALQKHRTSLAKTGLFSQYFQMIVSSFTKAML